MQPQHYVAIIAFICAAAVYGFRPTSDAAVIAIILGIAGCDIGLS